MSALHILRDPSRDICGDSAEQFLRNLRGPTALFLPGADSGRCRLFVTLLHGNEPSGVFALRRWLMSGQTPAVNVLAVIASVPAALALPLFSQRMLPGTRDLNRCFRAPYTDAEGLLASDIIALMDRYQPEIVVDMHNTSGSGPSFGVVNHADVRHDAAIALFTRRVVVSALNLGALMELSSERCPIVTVEVGGRMDDGAHELAWNGLQRCFLETGVLGGIGGKTRGPADTEPPILEVLHHPIRLELGDEVTLGYGDRAQPGCDVTLCRNIEQYNFGIVDESTCLGWVNGSPSDLFRAIDADGHCAVRRLLEVRRGRLYPAQSLKLFMITSNAGIARSDCLCYAVADNGGPLRSAA